MTDTINIWNGDGSQTEFTFSLTNYNSFYMTLNGYVRDELTYVEDPSYTWALDSSGTQAVLNKPLEVGKQFVLEVVIKKQPEVFYQNASEVLNDISLNKNILQALYSAQAALDHRGNPRIQAEDMNNQKIINLKDGTEDHHAASVGQLNSAVGNIDELVQRAEDAADESELYRDEALAASVDAANNAAAADLSAQEAEESANKANTMFKGDWEPDYPNGTDLGYTTGDVVLYQGNQYKSLIDNNTSVPNTNLGVEWILFLPGSTSSDEHIADIFQTYFQADGVKTDFDLTAVNPQWTPLTDNSIFIVLVNGETRLDWSLVVENGNSIIRFLTAPAMSDDPDTLDNIFVSGGSPKLVDDISDKIPVGGIMPFSVTPLPQGWLECDGSVVQAATYPELVLHLTGDGSATQAVLPDYRGVTLRGLDNGRGLDSGRVLNTYQEDSIKDHGHTYTGQITIDGSQTSTGPHLITADGTDTGSIWNTTDLPTATNTVDQAVETRMKNTSVVYAIKAYGTTNIIGSVDLDGLDQEVQRLNNEVLTMLLPDGQDLNNLTSKGIYQLSQSNTNTPPGQGSFGVLTVEFMNSANQECFQSFRMANGTAVWNRARTFDGTWGDWESLGISRKVLWSGPATSGTITLSEDFTHFKELRFIGYDTFFQSYQHGVCDVSHFKNTPTNSVIKAFSMGNNWVELTKLSNTQFTITASTNIRIDEINGLR